MSTVQESQDILRAFEFDRKRTNETSARTLLALAGLDESSTWADATNERMGVRYILDWMRGPLRAPSRMNPLPRLMGVNKVSRMLHKATKFRPLPTFV